MVPVLSHSRRSGTATFQWREAHLACVYFWPQTAVQTFFRYRLSQGVPRILRCVRYRGRKDIFVKSVDSLRTSRNRLLLLLSVKHRTFHYLAGKNDYLVFVGFFHWYSAPAPPPPLDCDVSGGRSGTSIILRALSMFRSKYY